MAQYKLAPLEKLEGNNRLFIDIKGTEIVVLEHEGEVYAVRNLCPHQYGDVGEGMIERKIVADVPNVGERIQERYEPGKRVIRCPCHGWAFDLDSGDNIADPQNAPGIQTYEATVEDGVIYIEI
jgi:nitrite reductase/ring-hydroxylating ferredoxin subunit